MQYSEEKLAKAFLPGVWSDMLTEELEENTEKLVCVYGNSYVWQSTLSALFYFLRQ